MSKTKKSIAIIGIAIMTALSLTGFFGLGITGVSVLVGIAFFFIIKGNRPFEGSGFDIQPPGKCISGKVWPLVLLPTIMDAVSVGIAKLFFPEFIPHVLSRVGSIVAIDTIALMIIQLAVLAIGEEIAWRAFFQKQLQERFPFVPVLIFSSLMFAIGHISAGSTSVVIYDVFFVFINSCIYGAIFRRTGNAWVSAISHFTANVFSMVFLVLLN